MNNSIPRLQTQSPVVPYSTQLPSHLSSELDDLFRQFLPVQFKCDTGEFIAWVKRPICWQKETFLDTETAHINQTVQGVHDFCTALLNEANKITPSEDPNRSLFNGMFMVQDFPNTYTLQDTPKNYMIQVPKNNLPNAAVYAENLRRFKPFTPKDLESLHQLLEIASAAPKTLPESFNPPSSNSQAESPNALPPTQGNPLHHPTQSRKPPLLPSNLSSQCRSSSPPSTPGKTLQTFHKPLQRNPRFTPYYITPATRYPRLHTLLNDPVFLKKHLPFLKWGRVGHFSVS